jgi:hypothetical protein
MIHCCRISLLLTVIFFNVILISFSSHIITFALVKIDTHPWSAACPTDSNGVFTFILFANLAFSGRFKLHFPFDFPIIKPPVHDRTLIPFCVAVSSSKGKSNGTIVVVAPELTQMSMPMSSLSNSEKQLEVVGGGVVNHQCMIVLFFLLHLNQRRCLCRCHRCLIARSDQK